MSFVCHRYCLVQYVDEPSKVAIKPSQQVQCDGPLEVPIALDKFKSVNDHEWDRDKIYHVHQVDNEGILAGWKPVYVRDVAESEEELEVGLQKLEAQNPALVY